MYTDYDLEKYGRTLAPVDYRSKIIDIRKKMTLLYSDGPKKPVYYCQLPPNEFGGLKGNFH